MDLRSRYRGALLGLAAGDALGTTLEFRSPGTFAPITDIVGGGPFGLAPGQWTDDTSMALCLAESLVECRGFDPADQLRRYVRWWRHGHRSCTGACFDIGTTTANALFRFEKTGDPYCGATDARSAGNGCLMRLAPVPLAFAADPAAAVARAADSSRTTHAAAECLDACRHFAALLVRALAGMPKADLLAPIRWPESEPLCPTVAAVAAGSFRDKGPPAIRGTGHVVACLEAALWAFDRGASFRNGALLAVNLGDDADTTGAVYGQIAGAFYGEGGIPPDWRDRLAMRDEIVGLADALLELARAP